MEEKEGGKNKVYSAIKSFVMTVARIVLGILIAIQINAWNGERKRVNFEKQILTQIRANLQQDSLKLAWFSKNAREAVSSGNKILNESPSLINDSIQYWLADVIYFDRFQSITNGFEVLKSKGLGNVSNQDLCYKFGSYYDDKTKLIVKGLDDIEWLFTNEWVDVIKEDVIDFEFKGHLVLDDYSPFLKIGVERNLLKMGTENWRGSAFAIDEGLIQIQNMMAIIDDEIN